MRPDAGRVDRHQRDHLSVLNRARRTHRREHPVIRTVLRPTSMPIPQRLPRTENSRHVTPRRPGPEPPRDPIQRPPMIIPRPTATTSPRRQLRLDHSPQLITDNLSTHHGPDRQARPTNYLSDTP